MTLIFDFDYLSTINCKAYYSNQQDFPARDCTEGRDQPTGSPGLMSKSILKEEKKKAKKQTLIAQWNHYKHNNIDVPS